MLHFVRKLPRKWLFLPLLLVAILVWIAVLSAPGEHLTVSFLDVGQGDAILIQTPSGQQVLVDGGPDSEKVILELGKRLAFWDRSIDLVVLTHPEDDHLVGLVEVLRRYKVGKVLESGSETDTIAYEEWLGLVEEKGIERTVARAGQQIDLGDGIRMEVLHPGEELLEGTGSDLNSNSVVLCLVWGEVSFLLVGDVEGVGEREMLHGGMVSRATVLKVGHHGGSSSSCEQFLSAAEPQVAVISVGEDNAFGHPDAETLERLKNMELYRTDESGTITFTTDGQKLWVEMER